MPRTKTTRDIPLRLRRKRDGSLWLIDAEGRPEGGEFPPRHVFSTSWLLDNGNVVKLEGDQLQLSLANGTATYRVTETDASGIHAELVKSKKEG